MARAHEDYGIDAPTVVRNLAAIGVVLLIVGGTTTILLHFQRIHPSPLTRILSINGLATGITWLVMASWMIASSKWLKHKVARALLDARAWRGDEAVLDVGCGHGLVAVNAAKRVPRGKVTGVDIWQERDLGGNSPQAIRANAEAAGVADRLIVDTGDARALPYADGSFDVVASMTAIHNIPDRAGRAAAIGEVWRVTRPGGQILMFDIRHARNYAAQLRAVGAVDVRMTGSILLWGPVGWRFSATKPFSTASTRVHARSPRRSPSSASIGRRPACSTTQRSTRTEQVSPRRRARALRSRHPARAGCRRGRARSRLSGSCTRSARTRAHRSSEDRPRSHRSSPCPTAPTC